jgi:hypothetical protein
MALTQKSKFGGIGQPLNEKAIVTDINDIIDSINNTPLPVNPSSGYYPINRDDAFVDSGLHNIVEVLPPFIPPTEGSLGLAFDDPFAGTRLLALDPLNFAYTFGNASYVPGTSVQADGGLSIQDSIGEAIIGCGISSPSNGVFRASGAQGFVTIGTTPSRSIGTFVAGSPAVIVGSAFNNLTGPSNTSTPARWTKVRDENGTIYWYPMYQ